jgi:hypothetical protein
MKNLFNIYKTQLSTHNQNPSQSGQSLENSEKGAFCGKTNMNIEFEMASE